MREDVVAPRARQIALATAEIFYGTGMLEGIPDSPARNAVSDAIRATNPHEGLEFIDTMPTPTPTLNPYLDEETGLMRAWDDETGRIIWGSPPDPRTYERDVPWAEERARQRQVKDTENRQLKAIQAMAEAKVLSGYDLHTNEVVMSSGGEDWGVGGASEEEAGGIGLGVADARAGPYADAKTVERSLNTRGAGLGTTVADLSTGSVSLHIGAVRMSIAQKIKKDADGLLFSLRMKYIENATRMDANKQGVGEDAPFD